MIWTLNVLVWWIWIECSKEFWMQILEFFFKHLESALWLCNFQGFIFCNSFFGAALIFCKEQQKHSGQQCSRSINLVSRDFVDSTAIATSSAVKKRSLCPQINPTLTFPLSAATFWPKYIWHKSRCALPMVHLKWWNGHHYICDTFGKKILNIPWQKFLNAITRPL